MGPHYFLRVKDPENKKIGNCWYRGRRNWDLKKKVTEFRRVELELKVGLKVVGTQAIY